MIITKSTLVVGLAVELVILLVTVMAALTGEFWTAFWLGVPGVIAALVSGYIAIQNSKLKQVVVTQGQKIEAVSDKVEVVHKATNSLVDRLVQKTETASKAEGKAEGKAEQKQETKEDSKAVHDKPIAPADTNLVVDVIEAKTITTDKLEGPAKSGKKVQP